MSIALLAIALATASPAIGKAPPKDADASTGRDGPQPWQEDGLGWGGFPFANYSTYSGAGFGALGSVFFYDGQTAPYKSELYFLVYASTKGVQTHRLQYDWLAVGGSRLRLTTRTEFVADFSGNYCGASAPGDCSDGAAMAAAEAAGIIDDPHNDDDAYDRFTRRYYKVREVRPNWYMLGRWAIREDGPRLEVFGSYYGERKRPGDFSETAPWPGSLYEQDFGSTEAGYVSLLQVGLMADGRDNEPAPVRGHWAEVSVRQAGRLTGSTFSYGGLNLTERVYVPLGTDRVVLADRAVVDLMWGAPPTSEMVRSGGTDFYYWFGGQRAGRGIRWRRVLGTARTMNQTELRATVKTWTPGTATVDLTPIVFFDAAYWADGLAAFGSGAFMYGTGGGMRIAINKNFILRGDIGVSPLEDWAPSVYLDVKNLF
ncbi:MAG: BamA/TamA family outer membrane protein [Myxococcota bacterium]|nr:BamA/TamA family outer membrane protein [Myxococcota bacterium]